MSIEITRIERVYMRTHMHCIVFAGLGQHSAASLAEEGAQADLPSKEWEEQGQH